MNAPFNPTPRREAMRIAGRLVTTDDVVEVRNPYDGSLVGTVPAARAEHVREAFAKAKAFKPKLSRYRASADPAKDRGAPARPQGIVRTHHLGRIGSVLEGRALRIEPRL